MSSSISRSSLQRALRRTKSKSRSKSRSKTRSNHLKSNSKTRKGSQEIIYSVDPLFKYFYGDNPFVNPLLAKQMLNQNIFYRLNTLNNLYGINSGINSLFSYPAMFPMNSLSNDIRRNQQTAWI